MTHLELGRPVDREGDADGARQMRGDGRRLRDDRQIVAAEHLVPPTRDRLAGCGDDAGEDVADSRKTGAAEIETAAAVVQQRRVGRSRCHRQDGIALVPGGSDRVVPLALRSKPSRRKVAVAAGQLDVVEVRQIEICRHRRNRFAMRLERLQRFDQLLLERRARPIHANEVIDGR